MNAPALSSVDPRTLSSSQRKCIALLHHGAKLHRVSNGYSRPGNRVALDVVRSLVGLGLVSAPPAKHLTLTYGGRAVAAMLEEKTAARTRQAATAARPSSAAPSGGQPPAGGDTAVRTEQ